MTEAIKEIHNRLNAHDKKIEELKKQLDTEDPYKPTGKCKKARHRLNAINKEIEEGIKEQLDKARSTLKDIIMTVPKQAFSKIEGIDEKKSGEIWEWLNKKEYIDKNGKVSLDKVGPDKKNSMLKDLESEYDNFKQGIADILILAVPSEQKKRSMVAIAPERIEFDFNSLKFYIDFTLVASERDGQSNIKGSIIYGTSRTLCFIFPNNENNCKECQRTVRCDRLEDKPLISFEVTQHGMIQSSGKLEDEWWIEDKSDLLELHYRALDLIWKDALDWANEIILP